MYVYLLVSVCVLGVAVFVLFCLILFVVVHFSNSYAFIKS